MCVMCKVVMLFAPVGGNVTGIVACLAKVLGRLLRPCARMCRYEVCHLAIPLLA